MLAGQNGPHRQCHGARLTCIQPYRWGASQACRTAGPPAAGKDFRALRGSSDRQCLEAGFGRPGAAALAQPWHNRASWWADRAPNSDGGHTEAAPPSRSRPQRATLRIATIRGTEEGLRGRAFRGLPRPGCPTPSSTRAHRLSPKATASFALAGLWACGCLSSRTSRRAHRLSPKAGTAVAWAATGRRLRALPPAVAGGFTGAHTHCSRVFAQSGALKSRRGPPAAEARPARLGADSDAQTPPLGAGRAAWLLGPAGPAPACQWARATPSRMCPSPGAVRARCLCLPAADRRMPARLEPGRPASWRAGPCPEDAARKLSASAAGWPQASRPQGRPSPAGFRVALTSGWD